VFSNYEDNDVTDSCCGGHREGVVRMSEECYTAREEAFLCGLCEGVQMERNFTEHEEKES
jgi:hypothetical protein